MSCFDIFTKVEGNSGVVCVDVILNQAINKMKVKRYNNYCVGPGAINNVQGEYHYNVWYGAGEDC